MGDCLVDPLRLKKGVRPMKFQIRFGCAIVFGIIGAITSSQASLAIPVGVASADSSHIREIDWACGPGLHVSPRGRCVPNYWGGGYGYPGGGGGYDVAKLDVAPCSDNSWTEAGITWNNAPNGSVGAVTATYNIIGISGEKASWDVTADVATYIGGNVSWRIVDPGADAPKQWCSAREYGNGYAQLVVDYSVPSTGRRRFVGG